LSESHDAVPAVDLTVLILGTAWSEDAHQRSLDAIQRLMDGSGLRVQALLLELLPQDANLPQLLAEPLQHLPAAWRERLGLEGFDYLCDYSCTARALRRAVRSARGHWVCLLREGDEIGFRRQADHRLQRRDLDILIGVAVGAEDGLAAHRALSGVADEARGLATLVGLSTSYEGGLIVRRDHLDDVLGQVGYDAEPGFFTYLNEVLTVAALREVGRVAFTEQLAVFPAPAHQERHRDRVLRYGLPVLPFRRREVGHRHEARTEALLDGILDRLRDIALARPEEAQPGRPSAAGEWRHCVRGEPTAHTRALLHWMVAQVFRGWGWHPKGTLPRASLLPCPVPAAALTEPSPKVSLVSSAFRGESVAYSFLSNLTELQGFDETELLLVCPQPNLVQDIVFGQFAAARPRIRMIALDEDPGIYACWNLAIAQARGQYVSNANLDDRRDRRQLQHLVGVLDATGADVASAAVAITHALKDITGFDGDLARLQAQRPLETWFSGPDRTPQARMQRDFFHWNERGEVTQCMNFPHCMPVWRRSLHERHGAFDENRHGTYADFALWLKAVTDGARFVHDSTPLGLYHVDPRSHNRRHANQVAWDEIVRAYLPPSVPIQAPPHVRAETRHFTPGVRLASPGTAGPVHFDFGQQLQQYYGTHRSGWAYAMQALGPFHRAGADVACNAFLEKRFVWGSDPGDGGCGPVEPLRHPWVGFLHVPPQVPPWFQFEQSNEQIFSKHSWHTSQRWCRGLFVLSDYHRRHLEAVLKPDFPISVLLHPTEFVEQSFSLDRWRDNPRKRLVQVGWWLRKLAAVHHLRTPGITPTLLGSSDWTKQLVSYSERRYHGLATVPAVDSIDFLDNDAYDRLLTENLVFVDFYDTSANNAVIECIARGTPIVVCRHPAVEEYVGRDYPLFFDHPGEIAALVRDPGRIAAAHRCLMEPAVREPLTLERFSQTFAASEVARWSHGG
jgi:hypothetical protein